MGRFFFTKIRKTSHKGNEHASEGVGREVVDHVGTEVETPGVHYSYDETGEDNYPDIEGEDYSEIGVKCHHYGKDEHEGVETTAQAVGPGPEVEGKDDGRYNQYVGEGVHEIFREPCLDEFVVVETVEEVHSLKMNQKQYAGSKVA